MQMGLHSVFGENSVSPNILSEFTYIGQDIGELLLFDFK